MTECVRPRPRLELSLQTETVDREVGGYRFEIKNAKIQDQSEILCLGLALSVIWMTSKLEKNNQKRHGELLFLLLWT